MSDVEIDLVDTQICIKCDGEKTGEKLDQVGALQKGREIFEGNIWYQRKRSNVMNAWKKTMHRQ